MALNYHFNHVKRCFGAVALLAVFPDGHYEYYDKHNCFKKGSFSPGEKQLVLNWKGHRLATYICYDLRFPDWSHLCRRFLPLVSRREDCRGM